VWTGLPEGYSIKTETAMLRWENSVNRYQKHTSPPTSDETTASPGQTVNPTRADAAPRMAGPFGERALLDLIRPFANELFAGHLLPNGLSRQVVAF
jgi:hypothetical protein